MCTGFLSIAADYGSSEHKLVGDTGLDS